MKQTYSFDDVLLTPQYSTIESRSQIDIGNNLDSFTRLELPVISSPMDTVTEAEMASVMGQLGGLGIIHRYNSIEEQANLVRTVAAPFTLPIAAAIGVTGDYEERACALYDAGARIICVDVAHGHHSLVKNALYVLREVLYDVVLKEFRKHMAIP